MEITAGRDFGFPIGYQSRVFVRDMYEEIVKDSTRTLRGEFDLPLYEGPVSLEGVYSVTMKVYVNDGHYIGCWRGDVFLGR